LADQKDIELIENNDTTVEVTVTKDGAPYDLTGKTAELYVKKSVRATDTDAEFAYTTANGRIAILPGDEGRLDIAFNSVDVKAGKFNYHLDIIDAGKRHTVAHGVLNVVNV
jgi:hypothetical protein